MDQEVTRTVDQNAKFHAMVRDISKQVRWAGEFIHEDDWKRLILAAKFGQKVVPNPFGIGFVVMNNRRSKSLKLEQMVELIGELEAFGAEQGVDWTHDED